MYIICDLLQYDKKWNSDEGFVFYDYNAPDAIAESLRGTFDAVIIDPPFIVEEVWRKYAVSAKLLLKPGADDNGMCLISG